MPRFTPRLLLLFLTLTTLVKVFDDDADKHVEYEEPDQQQERDEVEKAPLVMVSSRLQQTSRQSHKPQTHAAEQSVILNPRRSTVAEVRFSSLFVCVSVFQHDIAKIDAAMTIKRDIQMFHDESWIPIYFGVKRSKVKVTSHKNSAGVGLCTIVSAGFFQFPTALFVSSLST